LANDGAGTNILTSRNGATFYIDPLPTAAPAITSSTHPKQDRWYQTRDVTLSWSGSGSAFSYILDKKPTTTPDQTSEGTAKTKTYEDLTDGVWYFHARVKGDSGWSAASHYRIQIDSTPPEEFTPEADPAENAEKRPIIAYSAKDATSGIDHYEIRVDDGAWIKVGGSYLLPSISSGKHTVTVKAVDRAGHEREGAVDI
jgi:hypothetical protein